MRKLRTRAFAVCFGLFPFVVSHVDAQACLSADSAREVLSGQVVDAATRRPLSGADLVLDRTGTGCTGLWFHAVQTGSDGWYRFDGLAAGRYELGVRRLGYRPVTVTVELERGSGIQVSLGMEAVAIELEPLLGEAGRPGRQAFSLASPQRAAPASALRGDLVRDRQASLLATDARSLSEADVDGAMTLAEPDLLRALHGLPGVDTRDDFSAELWTRGAPADQTRIFFDGLPIYGPYHLLGMFAGVSADAVGSVTFHPGVRAARLGDGAASAVEMTSKRPDTRHLGGAAALSPLSGRVTLGRVSESGRTGWLVSGRRTFVDGMSAALSGLGVRSVSEVPYSFADVTGRFDIGIGDRSRIEWSGLYQEDRVYGDVPGLVVGNRARWGNAASRLTLVSGLGRHELRSTIGYSRFDVDVRQATGGAGLLEQHPATRNTIDHLQLNTMLQPAGADSSAWAFGVQASLEQHLYDGPTVDPTGIPWGSSLARRGVVGLRDIIAQAGGLGEPLALNDRLGQLAVWGQGRLEFSPRWSVEAGLRAEASREIMGLTPIRLAPRLVGRYRSPEGRLLLSAGYGRTQQYTQSLVRTNVLRAGLRASEIWLTASDTVPAIQADLLSGGAEYWLSDGWLASVNAYYRRSTGIALPDPTPGPVTGRALFTPALGEARGLELSVRKLTGDWTLTSSYALSTSALQAAGYRFPAPEDRRHTLTVSALRRVTENWRVGSSFAAASGAPYTRATVPSLACAGTSACPESNDPVLLGLPGAERGPTYVSLNLFADWTKRFDTWTLGVYFQLRNVLNRDNAVTYNSSIRGPTGATRDVFESGLPRLPVLGVRAWF